MEARVVGLPLYLVDASAWSHYGSVDEVTQYIDEIGSGGIIMTCPPASLEYCFMARSAAEHGKFRSRMERLKQPDNHPGVEDVLTIQSALWRSGLLHAAGAVDTLIAAYALLHDAAVVSRDRDFGHISKALGGRLRQVFLAP